MDYKLLKKRVYCYSKPAKNELKIFSGSAPRSDRHFPRESPMTKVPTITAFAKSPDRGRGLARDTIVRWALEEVGQPYEVRLLSFRAMKEPAHLALHPFGQIPTYEQGDLALFESGGVGVPFAQR